MKLKLDANDIEAIWKKAICARGEEAHLRDDILDLINDLQEARAEIERQKDKNKHLQDWREAKERIDDVTRSWWHEETAKIKHIFPFENSPGIGQIVERLLLKESHLQDALTVISDALTDVMDMIAVSEMEGRDMELCPQATMLSLHDDLHAAVQRLQEEGQDE